MRPHRLAKSVLALLEPAGLATANWIVRCRDDPSHPTQLRAGVSTHAVRIDASQSGQLTLTEAAQLRAAQRDASLTRTSLAPAAPPLPRRPGIRNAEL